MCFKTTIHNKRIIVSCSLALWRLWGRMSVRKHARSRRRRDHADANHEIFSYVDNNLSICVQRNNNVIIERRCLRWPKNAFCRYVIRMKLVILPYNRNICWSNVITGTSVVITTRFPWCENEFLTQVSNTMPLNKICSLLWCFSDDHPLGKITFKSAMLWFSLVSSNAGLGWPSTFATT